MTFLSRTDFGVRGLRGFCRSGSIQLGWFWLGLVCLGTSLSPSAFGVGTDSPHAGSHHTAHHQEPSALDHAPIGVMGDHTHGRGEWMFSYRFMTMQMQGNRDGSSSISPEEIVTTVANPFANPPMMPPTLRVVPLEMRMDMHMLGAMYAPTDKLTLMAMLNIIDLSMDHLTFAGPMGTTRLGEFTTEASGIGDLSLSGLINLPSTGRYHWHATLGVSLPTGSITEKDRVLAPTNMRPELRLPYPMQLSSGTFDFITGLTARTQQDRWEWGGQWRSVFRTGENDEDYRRGNEHQLSVWLARQWQPQLSSSLRLTYLNRGNLHGNDPSIRAPVQTADPDRQGLERLDLSLGVNYLVPGTGHRLAAEISMPVSQSLDGPQLETDWQLTLGWQWAL